MRSGQILTAVAFEAFGQGAAAIDPSQSALADVVVDPTRGARDRIDRQTRFEMVFGLIEPPGLNGDLARLIQIMRDLMRYKRDWVRY